MVTVKSYFINQSSEGKTYICFDLIGDMEVLTGKSGKLYVDVKKCSIPTRVDEATAKLMLGRQIAGSIVKKQCPPFEYTIPGTGEVVTIAHKYEYEP
ncbi:hypothetical protein [Chitinophaga filiformis]|uniref:Uncharacterized protein n=1 Tax=Chitinophaga filiformis TaxID=104663 RepID=A0ABY4HWX2_CHIFI|nr:hypothetical protein [Chitinophaga filiformis]UPK68301.1 hypothetical protein MYF79_25420 [Chitinophaga filiformis]